MNTTPSRDEVFGKIQQLSMSLLKLPSDRVKPESRLREDLEADSLFLTQFLFALEDDFGIETNDSDLERIFTVDDAVNYVLEKSGVGKG